MSCFDRAAVRVVEGFILVSETNRIRKPVTQFYMLVTCSPETNQAKECQYEDLLAISLYW